MDIPLPGQLAATELWNASFAGRTSLALGVEGFRRDDVTPCPARLAVGGFRFLVSASRSFPCAQVCHEFEPDPGVSQ